LRRPGRAKNAFHAGSAGTLLLLQVALLLLLLLLLLAVLLPSADAVA
jgi:hypothetical protein